MDKTKEIFDETMDVLARKKRTSGGKYAAHLRRPDREEERRQKRPGVLSLEDVTKHDGDVVAAMKEKRELARKMLAEKGSLPEWWDWDVILDTGIGRPRKFRNPEEFLSKGLEYFERCFEREERPTSRGLCLWMGFYSWGKLTYFARKNPEFRPAHATLLTILQSVGEKGLVSGKGTAAWKFWLSNLPEGFDVTDSTDAPLRYEWKEKQQTELTGLDGGPISVKREIPPEEAYLQMLEGGKLEEPKESDPVPSEYSDA
jgi:hypothetical protein